MYVLPPCGISLFSEASESEPCRLNAASSHLQTHLLTGPSNISATRCPPSDRVPIVPLPLRYDVRTFRRPDQASRRIGTQKYSLLHLSRTLSAQQQTVIKLSGSHRCRLRADLKPWLLLYRLRLSLSLNASAPFCIVYSTQIAKRWLRCKADQALLAEFQIILFGGVLSLIRPAVTNFNLLRSPSGG